MFHILIYILTYSMDSLKVRNVEHFIKQLKNKNQRKSSKIDLSNAPTCGLCKFILNNPYQTICGCLYCKECIESWLLSHTTCPGKTNECLNTVIHMKKGIREDRARAREVGNVKVKCLFDGCDLIMEINKMCEHLDVCKHRIVQCRMCDEDVVERDKDFHVQNLCCERRVTCRFCDKAMKSGILEKEHNNASHPNVCKEFFGECPYKCSDSSQNLHIVTHLQGCVNRPVLCPLTLLGCTVENLTLGQLDGHFRADVLMHNELLVQYTKTRNNKVKDLQLKLGELDEVIVGLRRNIDFIETDLQLSNKAILTHKPLVEVDRVDDEIQCRNGEFVWRVERFTQLIENAKAGRNAFVLSEPFYSSDFGYRMCLKIYPYGDGPGRGSHVSVFFVIMRGMYDEILAWPFTPKVKLTLLSSSKTDSGHSETFKPDARSPCYVKPVNSFNIGSGSPRFMSHDLLFRNYVVNDGFFIMAEILS